MDTNTEKTTSKAQTRMAIYFRYPKTPHDEAIVQQRINALTSAISAGNDRTLTEVYTDIGTSVDKNDPFPGFERMRQDYMDGKFDVLLTEPPHGAYRGLDEGIEYLLALREIGVHIIFTNGQTLPELLALSVFRSTMKALDLLEAMAIQELASMNDESMNQGEDEPAPNQPSMQL